MKSQQTKFILAVLLQIIVILGILVYKYSVVANGSSVLLRVMPVYSSGYLRGEYESFRFNISNVSQYQFSDWKQIHTGQTVYVTIEKQGKYWEASYPISVNKPTDGSLFIQGKVTYISDNPSDSTSYKQDNTGGQVVINYGIEEYSVPESSMDLSAEAGKEVVARVTIDGTGKALIRQILVDGKPWP
jgi:uncharacterized membrane-anchored protein